jgi:phosphatidate cytidylyltransferase
MGKRIIYGTVLIAVIFMLLWMDWRMEQARFPMVWSGGDGVELMRGLPLAGMIVLLVWAGYAEMARLAAAGGMVILRWSGLFCAIMIATLPFWRQGLLWWPNAGMLTMLAAGVTLMLLFLHQIARYHTGEVMRRVGTTLLTVMYLGVGGAMVLAIRVDFGLKALGLYLLVVKATDMGAYFVGSAIGRHKLIPWLSPGKSWEGLAGGALAAGALGAGFAALYNPLCDAKVCGSVGVVWAAVFGLVLAVFGQGADLAESAMKRDAGIKDSGGSIPGFGGILDVLDSLLLSAPAGYFLLAVMRN